MQRGEFILLSCINAGASREQGLHHSRGIDPGLAQVGYGVVNTADPMTLLACGVIRTRPGPSPGERMVEIARDLPQLVRQYRPQLAAVEGQVLR